MPKSGANARPYNRAEKTLKGEKLGTTGYTRGGLSQALREKASKEERARAAEGKKKKARSQAALSSATTLIGRERAKEKEGKRGYAKGGLVSKKKATSKSAKTGGGYGKGMR